MVVAVIDTGIDARHVDLAGGKVIAFHDWVNNRTDAYDDHGHGTHVSGIVAGTGAGNSAYTGVAPGAALVGLKVLDQNGSGSLSNVTAAVDWAVTHKDEYNIRVISMKPSQVLRHRGEAVSCLWDYGADAPTEPLARVQNSADCTWTAQSPQPS